MSQYDDLDGAILSRLKVGCGSPFKDEQICREARKLERGTQRTFMRVIDARLTALKKKGLIEFDKSLRE